MVKLKYVLDANIFIESARRYYSFDFGTKFWDFLKENAENGILCSIDKVFKEIQKGDKKDFKEFFLPTDNNNVLINYSKIVNYANNNKQYNQNAIDEFLKEDNADAWIIAFAITKSLTVVTHESYNPDAKKKVLIPNVCKDFNITYKNLFDMLKELNFKL
jgi:hypothetical protein